MSRRTGGAPPRSALARVTETRHLLFVRPEEERFVTADLLRLATFTATAEELRDRIRALRDAGFQQLAIQLVHGHESALDDWARVIEKV